MARVDLQSPNADARLAALEASSKSSATTSSSPICSSMLARRTTTGAYGEPDARVRAAAHARASTPSSRSSASSASSAASLHGLSLASVLLFAALGLAVTFGLLGVINMAHGEMLMLGAYSTYTVQTFFHAHRPGALRCVPARGHPGGVPRRRCVVGVLLERTVIRHLYGRPLETLLATWGISLGLIQTVRLIFGAQNVAVANPDWLAGGVEIAHGLVLPWSRIGGGRLRRSSCRRASGSCCRRRGSACTSAPSPRTARWPPAWGSRRSASTRWMFGLGSGIAGLGGVALSQLANVGPELGQSYIIDSFMVVVLGGVGRLAGAVAAALGLGVVNKLLEPVAGAVLGKIAVLVFIILFIQRRPQGLFAHQGARGGMSAIATPPRDALAAAAGSLLARGGRCSSPVGACPLGRAADYLVPLFGKFLCFGIAALAMDLRLGLRGHPQPRARALLRARRLRHGDVPHALDRRRGRLPQRRCPTSWSSSIGRSCPGTGTGSRSFPFAVVMCAGGARLPGAGVRLVHVPLAHPGRLPLDRHPGAHLRGDAALLPERHRLRRQQRPHRLQAHPAAGRCTAPRPSRCSTSSRPSRCW